MCEVTPNHKCETEELKRIQPLDTHARWLSQVLLCDKLRLSEAVLNSPFGVSPGDPFWQSISLTIFAEAAPYSCWNRKDAGRSK